MPDTLSPVIKRVNTWLSKNNTVYTLGIHQCTDTEETESIYTHLTLPSDCHAIKLDDCNLTYVYLRHQASGKVVTYLAFKIFSTPVQYIDMVWGCTGLEHRRKNLSTILRMVPIMMALQLQALVVSDANKLSGGLLKKRFGFVYNENGDYQEDIGNLVNWQSSPTAYLDLRQAIVRERTNGLIEKMFTSKEKLTKKKRNSASPSPKKTTKKRTPKKKRNSASPSPKKTPRKKKELAPLKKIAKKRTPKKRTPYQVFMSKTLRKLTKDHPTMKPTNRMKMAAKEWNKTKQ